MIFYSQEKIDEVSGAVDFVELVSSYISLKRVGTNYKGLCPFHSEKTPSFIVNPNRQIYHCFGCGVGGGPIRFLMAITGNNFPDAVEELARRYGVILPENTTNPEQNIPERENKAAIFEVLAWSKSFFEEQLWSEAGREPLGYLLERGLNQDSIKEFGLGFSPDGWTNLLDYLKRKNFSEKIMLQAGLIKNGRKPDTFYDTFRHRLMIPIFDPEKRVAGFGGRSLGVDEGPKYINSPETTVYKKERLLYGFHLARPFLRAADMVFLVEGYFDLISMVAAGINEVVAPLGTALTPRQVNLLRGHVREIMMVFDSDEAGQRATAKALPLLLNAELDGRVLCLPPGHDPDSFIREFGAEALYEAASKSMDIIDFQVAWLKKSHPDTPAGQVRMAREAKELIAKVPDTIKSQLLRRRLARMLGLDEELLGKFSNHAYQIQDHSRPSTSKENPSIMNPVAEELLRFILIHTEAAPAVLREMGAYWPDDPSRALFQCLKQRYELDQVIDPGGATDEITELAALVASTAVSPREYPPEETEFMATEYMDRIKDKWKKNRQKTISIAIRKAQEQGQTQELLLLLEEKKSL